MHEKICTVKRSCGSKRRPKVMTGIGRTHPTSGSTRHTTAFSLKKEVRVLSTPILSTRVPSDKSVCATASSSPSFLSSNSNSADARWVGWGFVDGQFAQLRPHHTVKMLRME